MPDGRAGLPAMARAVQDCHGCDLYERATQAVFGHGNAQARVMFIGEQPGDAEDRAGRPFVGPTGKLLDRALAEAGIAPEIIYVVTLGATAGRALFGSSFRVTKQRGTEMPWSMPARGGGQREITAVPTIHPSAVLRADDRDAAYSGLVSDLRVARRLLPSDR